MLDIDILNPLRCFTKTKEIDTIIFNDDDCNLHDYDLTNNNSNFNEKTGYSKNRFDENIEKENYKIGSCSMYSRQYEEKQKQNHKREILLYQNLSCTV